MIERLCLQDLLLTDTSHGGMKFKIEKEYPILHVRRIVFQSNQPLPLKTSKFPKKFFGGVRHCTKQISSTSLDCDMFTLIYPDKDKTITRYLY